MGAPEKNDIELCHTKLGTSIDELLHNVLQESLKTWLSSGICLVYDYSTCMFANTLENELDIYGCSILQTELDKSLKDFYLTFSFHTWIA